MLRAWKLCAAFLILLAGCSAKRPTATGTDEVEPERTRDAGARPKKDAANDDEEEEDEDECPASNPFCREREPKAMDETVECGNEVVALAPAGVNVMVAVDGSASMRDHWPRVRDAVRELASKNRESAFGVHMFWGAPIANLDALLAKSNLCGETQNRVLDVGTRTENELLTFLGNAPPGAGNAILPSSPLIEPLNYYLENATKLADPKRTNYLMVISDGVDNCFGSAFTNPAAKRLALEKLAVELYKKNIRIVPVSFVPDQGNMMGRAAQAAQARMEALDTLAKFGGSGLEKALVARDPDDLVRAVTQAGSRVGSCRFAIPAALDPTSAVNPFELNFAVNGNAVARDRKGKQGWDFVNGKTSEVELFGDACEAVRGGATVEAKKTCSTDICGSAAVKVETKPRAVLYVLDSSASRIECQSGGALSCFRGIGQVDRPVLTYWEVVQHALGQTLVAPINDDVEFGLQFFPFKTSGALSCEVAEAPEVAPETGTSITIMSQMLERLPFGRSPISAALASVAADPGRLADPNVSGAVVLLTDGGDNCAGEQPQILASLEASAKKLYEQGIETYVVRFGKPDAKTPEQEAQLRTVVEHGGSATMGETPYIDALTAQDLEQALAKVSDRLATCSFEISGVPDGTDKAKANLYLNGELIRFDGMDEKSEGWGWANAEQTAIDLFGSACEAFKTNRKTSVVIEFGCESILLI